MIAQYSVASVDTTKAANALDLWCPSSKTALFQILSPPAWAPTD